MRIFYKKTKYRIVMMIVLAMLLQIIGPMVSNVYADGVEPVVIEESGSLEESTEPNIPEETLESEDGDEATEPGDGEENPEEEVVVDPTAPPLAAPLEEGVDPDAVSTASIRLEFKDKDGNVIDHKTTPVPVDASVKFSFGLKIADVDYDNLPMGIVDKERLYRFKIADQINISSTQTISIMHEDQPTVQVATAIIYTDGTMTVQFLPSINDDEEERFVWVEANGRMDASKLGEGGDQDLEFEVMGKTETVTIKFEENKKEEKITLSKDGRWDKDKNEITWTITVEAETKPSGGKVENVVIEDILGAGQAFISHNLGDATYDESTKKYNFAEIADGETKTITIVTKPDLSAFYPEKEGKEVKLENTAKGIFGPESIKIPEVTAEVKTTIDFIDKHNGTFHSGDTRAEDKISWQIDINKNNLNMPAGTTLIDNIPIGLELILGSIKIDGKAVSEFDGATLTEEVNEFNILFAKGLSKKAKITYDTKITDANAANPVGDLSYTNTSILTWDGKSVRDEGTIGVGKYVIEKWGAGSSNNDDRHVRWQIRVNYSKTDITNPVVTDTLPKELEYVSHNAPAGWTFEKTTDAEGMETLTFKYNGTISTTHIIDIGTRVKVEYKDIYGANKTTEFTNQALIKGDNLTEIQSNNAKQVYYSNVIAKTGTGYDYISRKASWEIVVNQNNMTINNAVITDTIGENHEFVDGSLELKDGTITRRVEGEPGVGQYSVIGKVIKINLGNITDQQTITFKTIIPEDKVNEVFDKNGVKTLRNNATLTGIEIIEGGQAAKEATNKIENTLISKKAEYTNENDYIDWVVEINLNSLNLGEVTVEDNLVEGLILDKNTVKLYNLKMEPNGGYEENEEAHKVEVEYTPDNKAVFKLGEITKPYLLKFRTDIEGDKADETFTNTIKLNGTGSISDNATATKHVKFDNSAGGGGGSKTRGSIRIIKTDINGKVLVGVKFELLDINKNPFSPRKENQTDDNGEIFFDDLPMATYWIRETFGLEGYKVAEDKQIILKKGFDTKDQEITIVNEMIEGNIEFKKEDSSGNPLKGAKFGLYRKSDEKFRNIIQEVESDKNGLVKFENIPYGAYKIKETIAPVGYVPSDTILELSIIKDGETVYPSLTPIVNKKIKGDIEVIKLSEDGKTLSGAIFELVQDGEVKYTSDETDNNGRYVFENLVYGTYILREKKAPEGHNLSNETFKVVVEKDKSTQRIYFTNTKIKGNFELTKTDISNSKPLRNARIAIYTENDVLVDEKLTDSDGIAKFENLPYGKYYFKETKAPSGYYINNEKHPFEIKENGEIIKATLTNERIPYDPEEPADPKPPVDPDSEKPVDPEKPTEPKVPEEPEKPVVPTQPTKPTEPTEPTDPEGSTPKVVEEPKNGKVTFDENGKWIYTPNPDFVGKDSFIIKVTHPDGTEEDIFIEIDVEAPSGGVEVPTLPKTGQVNSILMYLAGLFFIVVGIILRKRIA